MADARAPAVPGRQRRRDGAGDVQGPAAAGRRSAPAHRGHDHLPPTPSRRTWPTSSCAGSTRWRRARAQRAIAEAYAAGYSGQEHPGHRATAWRCTCTPARAATCAARRPGCSTRSRASARSRVEAAVSRSRGLWGKPTVVNNVETLCNVPHIVNHGAEWFKRPEHAPRTAARSSTASAAR